ncbi:glycosyltransferase family 4 protein [Vogesella sp. LIG4]|uniref:glycosyltransferase family 4 protein n=1 Tax=Vogesella sp. LIG4 TaxID=1192162 RepID=UPI00081FA4E5|nr:glycosyltransferase family 4 protein [Vogesella sp. LIG4]SCK09382.1 Glycosyltransferase involved in cell wall bisynthesis [Vogesella sp. LIG4]
MQIIYVITKAERGGAQLHVLNLIQHQLKQGHNVFLLCGTEGFLTEKATVLGAQVILCPEIIHPIHPLHDIKALFVIRQHLRRLAPNLVHAHSSKAGILTRLACYIEKIPCVFTAHGWAFSEGASLGQRLLGKALEKWIARLGQSIITVSEYDRQLAISKKVAKPSQLFTIHNGIESITFPSQSENVRPKNTLIMVARFAKPKNPKLLLEAMPLLPKNVHCILVGDGPSQSQCKKLTTKLNIESRIEFTGESDNIPALLGSASIFILLSHHEGLPLAIIEAMRSGLPVVASDVGGIPELVEDGVTGFLVPRYAKPKTVASLVLKILNDSELLEDMGKAARKRYLMHFTEKIMLDKINNVYQNVIDNY